MQIIQQKYEDDSRSKRIELISMKMRHARRIELLILKQLRISARR
jgi:hypothetical protein